MNRIRLCLLALLLCIPTRPAWGLDPEILTAQGIERIGAQDYAGAVQKLEQALAADPDNAEACYYAGLAYARLGKLAEARRLLERARALAPDLADVSFELGALYARSGDCTAAENAFDAYRARAPQGDRSGDITLLLQDCGGGAGESFLDKIGFRLHAGMGGNYDTNVTLEPDNPVEAKDRRPDFSGILFLSARAVPLHTRHVNLGLDYDFFQSFHVEESEFNVNFNRVSPTVSFPVWDFLLPTVGYAFENTLLAWDTYGRTNEAFGKALLKWGNGLFTEIRYAFRDQDYFNTGLFPTNALRAGNANVVTARQYAAWKGIDFQLFGQGDFDRAAAPYWSYDGFSLGLEAAFKLWVLEVGLSGAYIERHYRADFPGTLQARLDREQNYTAAVSYGITPWLTASLINTTVINRSNLAYLFSYNRNVTGIFLAAGLP